MRGEAVEFAHPAIGIYARLEAMEWNHLYRAGGLEDQDPMLLRYFDILNREKAKFQKAEQDKHQKEVEARSKSKPGRVAGRRR